MRWVLRWQRPLLAAACALLLLAAILGAASGGSNKEPVKTSAEETSTTTTTTRKVNAGTGSTGSTTSSSSDQAATTTSSTSTTSTSSPGRQPGTTRPPDEEPAPTEPPPTEPPPTEPPPTEPPPTEPPPVNQPLSINVSYVPSNPKVGQQVRITVNADDPDAASIYLCIDGFSGAPGCNPPDGSTPGTGTGSHETATYTASFLPPGDTTITVRGWSWTGSYGDFYSNFQTVEITIQVDLLGTP